jgi:glutamine amidotransferase
VCRHVAWLGESRTIAQIVLEQEYGFLQQSPLPRWQREGIRNIDGFGAVWYEAGRSSQAGWYRRPVSISTDQEFQARARGLASGCVLAAIRSATPGMPIEEEATAPFSNGTIAFSHNGHINTAINRPFLVSGPPPASRCDSALLAALLWQEMSTGADLDDAVPALVGQITGRDPTACLNILATDGEKIVATTWGETLCYRRTMEGVVVASEPLDLSADWTRVADRQVLHAEPSGVKLSPL